MTEHTPWRLHTRHHGASDTREVIIHEGRREVLRVAGDSWDISDFLSIVQACNSHEELLAACQYLCAEIHNGCNRKDEAFMRGVAKAEAIIRKAEREAT